jgi:transcription antitermination factor NusG
MADDIDHFTQAERDRHNRHLRLVSSTGRPWRILRVTPNMERKVAAALGPKTRENPHGAGLAVYVPLERFRPATSWRSRLRPLIRGYIFADLPDDDALDLARKNHAVRDVMCADGKPVSVPSIDVGAMIFLEAYGAFDTTWDAPPPRKSAKRGRRRPLKNWRHGQRVKVSEGPFAGHVAQIVTATRADRINVLVTIFGRATEVTLDEEMLDG